MPLRRRRIVRVRSPEVSRARRLRPAARALLPGGHGHRLSRLEARLESALSAAQRGLSRAPRHHWQAIHRRADPGRAPEEPGALLLEEHSRVAAPGIAFLLYLGR